MAFRPTFFLSVFLLFSLGIAQCPAASLNALAASGKLTETEVVNHLNRHGYPTVWHLERRQDIFVGEALDLAGNPVEIQLDTRTGQVVLSEGFRFLHL